VKGTLVGDLKHGMVDVETLGIKPGSVILSIGAIIFNPFSDGIESTEESSFYVNIDLKSSMDLGLKVDSKTLQWWWDQKRDLPRRSLMENTELLPVALVKLSRFLNGTNHVWSHGASFDPVLLQSAYDACDLECPWKFYNLLDTRTIFYLAKYAGGVMDYRIRDLIEGDRHNANYDAWVQSRWVQNAFRSLGGM